MFNFRRLFFCRATWAFSDGPLSLEASEKSGGNEKQRLHDGTKSDLLRSELKTISVCVSSFSEMSPTIFSHFGLLPASLPLALPSREWHWPFFQMEHVRQTCKIIYFSRMIYLENYQCSTSRTDECTKRSEAPRRAGWRECGPMGAQWLALLLAGALLS